MMKTIDVFYDYGINVPGASEGSEVNFTNVVSWPGGRGVLFLGGGYPDNPDSAEMELWVAMSPVAYYGGAEMNLLLTDFFHDDAFVPITDYPGAKIVLSGVKNKSIVFEAPECRLEFQMKVTLGPGLTFAAGGAVRLIIL